MIVEKTSPLIHCITNPISMMQCANAVLALGARPIMAEHPREVKEITATADALLLNLGNISDTRMEAMEIAFEEAVSMGIPVVIDAVGVACSSLRRDFIMSLLDKRKSGGLFVVKGNYSEIMAICDESYRASGVDAREGITPERILEVSKELAQKFSAVILASGSTDVVTDGESAAYINDGCPELSKITGTGCMLGAICATLLASDRKMDSVIRACKILGTAGELSRDRNGTFLVKLLDNLSLMNEKILEERGEVKSLSLYLVTDSTGLSEDVFLQKVEAALKGGVTFLQIREKDRPAREYIELAKKVHDIVRRYNVPMVVDDRVDVAMAVDAEGVHLGQSDMPVDVARRIMGQDKIIGATAKTVEQAMIAQKLGADYLGVGAIYPTTTKVKTVLTSVDTLRDICGAVSIPVNAIGGLNKDNVDILKGVPIAGICVVSAIMKAEDSEAAARKLKQKIKELNIG